MTNIINEKYGHINHKQLVDFHHSRIMFAIKDDELYIAEKGMNYSMAEWFENKGWINEKDSSLMDVIVRGFLDSEGIYFYCGYDFHTSEIVEETLKRHLNELVTKLNIDYRMHVYAGMIKQPKHGKFPPQKFLGTIEQLL